ncbi:unnamed protein product [Boreogadus saida]
MDNDWNVGAVHYSNHPRNTGMNVKRCGDVSLLILICHGYIVWVKGGDGTRHPMHHTANCALMYIYHQIFLCATGTGMFPLPLDPS